MALQAVKLYPPNIEGTIPAFYGTTLVVPFSMNRTVNPNSVVGFEIKIKTVQSGRHILTLRTDEFSFDPVGEAIFKIHPRDEKKFNLGQFYKIQLAYLSNSGEEASEGNVVPGLTGYYSTVAIVKKTTEPVVKIDGLEKKEINVHNYDYYGVYSQQGGDITEKVYSYCFNLYDSNGNILQTSGEQIHNSTADIQSYESVDKYTIESDLTLGKSFFIEYIVTTTNKMTISSGRYKIAQKKFVTPEIQADLLLDCNFENGYNIVSMRGRKDEYGVEYAATGKFKILRSSDESKYDIWNEVLRFAMYGQQPSKWSWRDMTTKQGVTYKYALQQYNDQGLNSNRIETNEIYSDFEHAFLFDGKRQLKIKYNPKVSVFKNNILENKVNTIGSKFPFIFRNGTVKYKEFAISGLISCQSDEGFLFANEEYLEKFDGTINLIGENIAVEREFKLDVLDWLNDGKPKLFRSPAEGNYIVRLVNVSLSPIDSVGRMLHTFTATAYEIAEYTYENLIALGIFSVEDPSIPQLRWETINLNKAGLGNEEENLLNYKAVSLRFEGMVAGDILHIDDGVLRPEQTFVYENGKYVPVNYYWDEEKQEYVLKDMDEINYISGYDVIIGETGSYIVEPKDGVEFISVTFKSSEDRIISDNENPPYHPYVHGIVQHQGSLTYGYYSKTQNRFDSISNITMKDVATHQFFGECDVLGEIQNVHNVIQEFYWLRAILREIVPATREYVGYNTFKYFYIDGNPITKDPYVLYQIHENGNVIYYDSYYDKVYDYYDPYVYFGNKPVESMDLTTTKEYCIKAPKDLHTLKLGNGVMAELSYQLLEFEYKVETSDRYPELKQLRQDMDNAYISLQNALCPYTDETETEIPVWTPVVNDFDGCDTEEEVKAYLGEVERRRKEYEFLRGKFLEALELALKEEEAIQGVIV